MLVIIGGADVPISASTPKLSIESTNESNTSISDSIELPSDAVYDDRNGGFCVNEDSITVDAAADTTYSPTPTTDIPKDVPTELREFGVHNLPPYCWYKSSRQ